MDVVIEYQKVKQTAEIRYFSSGDLDFLGDWESSAREKPSVGRVDAHTFAGLAIKRYDTQKDFIKYANGDQELSGLATESPNEEVGNLVVLNFPRYPECSIIGVCHFRRTWCNNVVIDYLATYPAIVDPSEEANLKGVGLALMYFVSTAAVRLNSELIWGEATEISHGFYDNVFKTEGTRDLISVPREKFEGLVGNTRREYARFWSG